MPRVFLVTGCSSGFGNLLIHKMLKERDIAVAMTYNPETLKFTRTSSENFLALKLNITNISDRKSAFEVSINKFGYNNSIA